MLVDVQESFFLFLLGRAAGLARLATGGEDELLAGDAAVEVEDVLAGGLKVRGGVVGRGDEDLVLGAVLEGDEGVADEDVLVEDGAEETDTREALSLGVVSLDSGGDDGDVLSVGGDVVGVRDDSDVDIVATVDLVLGDDDLDRVDVLGVGDGVVEDADDADDLSGRLDLVGKVRGVTDDEAGLGNLLTRAHSSKHAVLVDDLVDGLVEHVSSSVDGTQTGKGLGELTESVEWVDVGRLGIAGQRLKVETDAKEGLESRTLEVTV